MCTLVTAFVLSLAFVSVRAESPAGSGVPEGLKMSGVYTMSATAPVRISSSRVEEIGLSKMGVLKMKGMGKAETKSKIEGPSAVVRTTGSCEFYFKSFDPEDFDLVKLDQKDDSREYVSGTEVGGGRAKIRRAKATVGVPKKDRIEFTVTPVDDDVFRVVVDKPLGKGEYAFVGDKVYTFGVD